MSNRSRREHKPTSKYLSYYKEELGQNVKPSIPTKSSTRGTNKRRTANIDDKLVPQIKLLSIHNVTEKDLLALSQKEVDKQQSSRNRTEVTSPNKIKGNRTEVTSPNKIKAYSPNKEAITIPNKKGASKQRKSDARKQYSANTDSAAEVHLSNSTLPKETAKGQDQTPEPVGSTERRRSGRQPKPNEKLKEFVQSATGGSKASTSKTADHIIKEEASVEAAAPVLMEQKKAVNTGRKKVKRGTKSKNTKELPASLVDKEFEEELTISCLDRPANKAEKPKFVAAISPMIRMKGISEPITSHKNLSVGLVDCFEGLEKDLAKVMEKNKIRGKKGKTVVRRPKQKGRVVRSCVVQNGRSVRRERFISRPVIKNGIPDQSSEDDVDDDDEDTNEPLIEVAEASTSRGIRKARDHQMRSVPNKRQPSSLVGRKRPLEEEVIGRANKLRRTKSPVVITSSGSAPDSNNPRKSSRTRNSISKIPSSPDQPRRDVRFTLEKFIIMGSKVASAISQTLKNNEEELLTKSSAFEKKCLNLVHQLANSSSDIEEDDMEKIIKLLDEEQEERKSYRQAFLESLRVSHITNMALYSQMLRLLRTL